MESNPFGTDIELLSQQKQIKGKPVEFSIISAKKDIQNIDLLFIPEQHKIPLEEVLEVCANQEILTVSEKKNYADKGVMINLKMEYGELKVEINKKAIDNKGFKAHSKLYQIASKVIQ